MIAWGCADAQVVAIDAEGWREDVQSLTGWVAAEQSFSASARGAALRRIDELLAGEPARTAPELFVQVGSVVGLADNGHSNLNVGPAYDFGLVPVRTYWFSDGLYVVRARADHAELLGARIDSIGGRSVDELVPVAGVLHGGTDGYFRQYFSEPLLLSPALLHALGVVPDAGGMALSLTPGAGGARRVVLEADEPGAGPARSRPWLRLLADPLAGENGGWVAVRSPGATVPLALRDPGTAFRYELLDGAGVAYVQLRSNIDQDGVSIRDFASDVRARLERDRPRHVVLDNRFNPGGDLGRTSDLALDLPTLVPPEGRVWVLTSNATFSAGIYTSFYPKSTDPARTVVVGEHVGDRERFWAESRGPWVLPRSGWRIGVSLQMHDLGTGCAHASVCHLAGRGRMDIAVGSLEPDVVVPTTYADFAAGRDPVLEYVLAQIGR